MIILIPLGGKGERFKLQGYKIPKALIEVENKPIIFWLLDNIVYKNIDYIYIPYNIEYNNYNFQELLKLKYPNFNFKFLVINHDTLGATHTISIALENIKHENDKPILCLDADNFYTTDIIKYWNGENKIFTFSEYSNNNNIPKYSYISLNQYNYINNIIEKKRIITTIENEYYACTGAYGFASFIELYEYSIKSMKQIYKVNNEYYISGIVKNMISDNILFKNETINNKDYFSLGTPEQINEFEYVFLFDLDGTLVDTNDLYIDIWREILLKYNIHVNNIFFNKNIKGLSDSFFLKSLIPYISDNEIKEISRIKDELFINNINKIKIYDNCLDFLKKIQNCRTAIVTNCNKTAAINIMKYFNFDKFINVLISSNDCIYNKPNAEPYIKAIKELNATYSFDTNKCFVFEDSFPGYMSAKNANINTIFIKINSDTENNMYLLNTKKFNNYNELRKETLLDSNNIDIIRKCYKLPIYKIDDCTNDEKNNEGYIYNIYYYKLTLNNFIKKEVILKLSNNDNLLSITANKLNLYKNEKNFYDNISTKINDIIKIPKCYGVFEDKNKVGIILENLKNYDGSFNLNLNDNINLLLIIIDNISKLHLKYYFENDEDIKNFNYNIKKINEYTYYKILIYEKYNLFKIKNKLFITNKIDCIFDSIYKNFDNIIDKLSSYPLNLCHGDLKSPNIFYYKNKTPYFLDWQYINLSKGISDVIFLLVESIEFNKITCDIVINYYYKLITENKLFYDYNEYIIDLKLALCCFPFFVIIWFNSEDSNILTDKTFPLRFMKNTIKYINYLIDDEFLQYMNNMI